MMRCDAHWNERATTTITFNDDQSLDFCNHHSRIVIDSLVAQGKHFTVTRHDVHSAGHDE